MKKIILICIVLLCRSNINTLETQTDSKLLYEEPVITQVQELYSKPVVTKKVISQPIITKKIISQPIIKQRVVQTPIIRKKVVQRPVYTETQQLDPIVDNKTQVVNVPVKVPGKTTIKETYYQPTVLTKDVQLQVNKGKTFFNNLPEIVKPTQYSEEVVNKVVQAPAKEIYTQPVYQSTIINNQEKVQFQKADPIYVNKPVITREPVLQERTRTETITRPGKQIYNNTFIQPVVQREHVNVQYHKQPDHHVQLHDVVQPTQYNHVHRTQQVHVPANHVVTQPIVQNYVHKKFIHHVQEPYVNRVPVVRHFPVPTPVIKKVPVIRKIPIPVASRKRRGTKIINVSKVHLNGYGHGYGSHSHGYSDSYSHSHSDSYSSHSHSYGRGHRRRGYGGMSMPGNVPHGFFPVRPKLKPEQIDALRKVNQDAAGFTEYGPNGYYHNFVTPEPTREYYNVYADRCVNCPDLLARDRQRERRSRVGGRGSRFLPLPQGRPQVFAPPGTRTTFDGFVRQYRDGRVF